MRLKVSGPFHTKYMEEASVKLRDYLEKVEFNKPSIPLVLNVTGDFYEEKSNRKDILKEQVKSGVRFEASICRLLDKGATRFIEIGPGNALSSFVKKIAKAQGKDVEILNIDTLENLESVIGGDKSGK